MVEEGTENLITRPMREKADIDVPHGRKQVECSEGIQRLSECFCAENIAGGHSHLSVGPYLLAWYGPIQYGPKWNWAKPITGPNVLVKRKENMKIIIIITHLKKVDLTETHVEEMAAIFPRRKLP